MKPPPVPTRDRIRFGWAVAIVCAVIGALIWALWVGPVNRSIAAAQPAEVGTTLSLDLAENQTVGIWANGISSALGTMDCEIAGPNGSAPAMVTVHGLGWEDTLWWITARSGFEQYARFTASEAGAHTVTCADSLDTYDGSFLLADDTGTNSSIGLGRLGAADFPAVEVLAFSVIVCPLVAVLLIPIMTVQTLRLRRHSRRNVGDSFR